jgi:hypothetical protein
VSSCTRTGYPNCGLAWKRPATRDGQSLQMTTTSHFIQLLSAVKCCIRNLSVSSNLVTTTFEEWTGTASSLLSDFVAVAPSMKIRPVLDSTPITGPEWLSITLSTDSLAAVCVIATDYTNGVADTDCDGSKSCKTSVWLV